MRIPEKIKCEELNINIKHDINMYVSEIFLFNLLIAFMALIASIIAICYKSKCEKVNVCCGVLKFERSISAEVELDENPHVNQVEPVFRIPHIDDENENNF